MTKTEVLAWALKNEVPKYCDSSNQLAMMRSIRDAVIAQRVSKGGWRLLTTG